MSPPSPQGLALLFQRVQNIQKKITILNWYVSNLLSIPRERLAQPQITLDCPHERVSGSANKTTRFLVLVGDSLEDFP